MNWLLTRRSQNAEVKLVDEPEMGYTANDKEGPAGQILVSGPNVSRGYLQLEEKTCVFSAKLLPF